MIRALAAVVALAGCAGAAADSRFHGAWELVSVTITSADGEVTPDAYGASASGMLSYQPSGHMMALVTTEGRPEADRSRAEADDTELAAAMRTLIAYAGRWSVDGNTVTHHVTVADWPARLGAEHARQFRFEGERLILTVSAPGADGEEREITLTWRRPAAGAAAG